MAGRGRRQLKALAAVVALLSACERPPQAASTAHPPASGPAPAARGAVREATCTAAPFHARALAFRRDTADSIQVELALANVAQPSPPVPGRPRVPDGAAVQAAMQALDDASVLTGDGR